MQALKNRGYLRISVGLLLLVSAVFIANESLANDDLTNDNQVNDIGAYLKRPISLVNGLEPGDLKDRLLQCMDMPLSKNEFSISHRGAPLGFAEHTKEGYIAAANMGAGIIECDVTFTSDKTLVCRHSQCDLHTTTNILETELADKCSVPPNMGSGTPFADVKCCTSDITVEEFKSLKGRMDAGDKSAKTVADYLAAEPKHRLDSRVTSGTLMTHAESVELFKSLGVKMTPELKAPQVTMPYQGSYTQADYAQALVNDFVEMNVDPQDVYIQSFNLDDVLYFIEHTPRFGKQAVWLDGRYRDKSFNVANPKSWTPDMQALQDSGVQVLAPPLWMLLDLDKNNQIVPSSYALAARDAGLDLIAWTLERSGPLAGGGGWYYQTIKSAINEDSDIFRVLNILAEDVKVKGVFSDWPATSTFYANCMW